MASDSQRRFHSQTPPNAPSTATLFQSGGGSQVVQAAFARPPPSLRSTQSYHTLSESPYSSAGRTVSLQEQSISEKFSLSPDPSLWGATLAMNLEEPDDELHNPDPRRDRKNDRGGSVFTYRGLTNLGCLIFLAVGMVSLFAGYPMISYFTKQSLSNEGGFNIGGINASGQIPTMTNNYGLIDVDTPSSAHTYTSFADSSQWQLVFSDEFEVEGRTFWPGDDPYWEAVNLHYWQTNDLEWYYPDQVTTRNGSLEITLSEREMNNLSFTSGLISTWNKFCFTGGMVLASVSLPGTNDVSGLWPAVWSMGNLGRVGYGASLEGMWPYSYDACDVGTAPNQTINSAPAAAVTGNPVYQGVLAKEKSHPGPVHSDGTYVGRSAPEIDVFESQVTTEGQVSQSAQWAPMNHAYQWSNTSQNYKIPNPDVTQLNSYLGGVYQQSTSGVTNTNQSCYTQNSGCFSTYGYEYKPVFTQYISWITNDVVGWTLDAGALVADSVTEISDRPIPQEPMYLITNLGISENFQTVDFTNLIFPATMRIDWIRVYQPQGSINIGCDPKDFPTAAYINEYIEAYTNPNLTTWRNDFQQPFPKNNLTTGC
ncbi:glycoside hydrolase family 16 protein [Suillus variegatus]|nr:glycoside hydrolase family 16 protein [Suillus variegatus]